MKEWFEEWFDSPYYHLLYQHRNDDEATNFVKQLVAHIKPSSNATLLDLACGKGRHAKAFADLGLDVTGVDLSPQSIEAANKFKHQHLHFYTHDMRHLFRSNYFDIVCNLFTSFGYFKSHHDHILVANNIYHSLKKGGVFVFDFINASHAKQNIIQNPFEDIQRENVHFNIQRSFKNNQVLKSIQIKDGTFERTYTERVNVFTLKVILDLFVKAGLTHLETFGNYSLAAYDEIKSPRMIMLFEK